MNVILNHDYAMPLPQDKVHILYVFCPDLLWLIILIILQMLMLIFINCQMQLVITYAVELNYTLFISLQHLRTQDLVGLDTYNGQIEECLKLGLQGLIHLPQKSKVIF